ncbi:hypothetical protein BC826DRAFT_1187486 [Russula brevipes]|nr:hypothetical protein BC826DRAFT_1187486 [Russula brevipes]
MKLFAIASSFVLSSILVSGSALHLHRRGPPSICGEGSVVLDETSVSHDGSTILVSTSTCPPTKRDTTVPKRSTINIDKRQNICTDGACTVKCDTTPATSPAADCTPLIKYIASFAPGKLTLAAGAIQTWSNGTCGIAAINVDTVSYTICYSTIASDATLAANACLGKTSDGACIGSGASGDNYAVGITSNVTLSA